MSRHVTAVMPAQSPKGSGPPRSGGQTAAGLDATGYNTARMVRRGNPLAASRLGVRGGAGDGLNAGCGFIDYRPLYDPSIAVHGWMLILVFAWFPKRCGVLGF